MKTFFSSLLIVFVTIFVAPAFSANLPSGYTELEYIESTGTQYIDTGVVPEAGTHAKIKFAYMSTSGYGYAFGDQEAGHYFALRLNGSGKLQFLAGGNGIDTDITAISGTLFTAELSVSGTSATYIVNDVSNTETIQFSSEPGIRHIGIFANGVGESIFKSSARCYGFSVDNNGTMIRNMVPAKHSSGVVGMYDLINDVFYTNFGTGTFTAGPAKCRNLVDIPNQTLNQGLVVPVSNLEPGVTYSASAVIDNITSSQSTSWTWELRLKYTLDNVKYYIDSNHVGQDGGRCVINNATIPVGATDVSLVVARYNGFVTGGNLSNVQIEQGATATDYVQFCSAEIKIATTAYNAARFNPVVNDLNSTVATIREIVTKTINQTAAIASLQADKQTRPEDACPAGKKCLLVETEENGVIVPHWFPIIEAPTD